MVTGYQTSAGEFFIVNGELSNLRCLMNTLIWFEPFHPPQNSSVASNFAIQISLLTPPLFPIGISRYSPWAGCRSFLEQNILLLKIWFENFLQPILPLPDTLANLLSCTVKQMDQKLLIGMCSLCVGCFLLNIRQGSTLKEYYDIFRKGLLCHVITVKIL